jgi:hypothetical protein
VDGSTRNCRKVKNVRVFDSQIDQQNLGDQELIALETASGNESCCAIFWQMHCVRSIGANDVAETNRFVSLRLQVVRSKGMSYGI